MIDWLAHEELEAEWNARFDYISEAYGATARDCNDFAADEAREEHHQACVRICDDMEARGGPLPRDFGFDDYIPF